MQENSGVGAWISGPPALHCRELAKKYDEDMSSLKAQQAQLLDVCMAIAMKSGVKSVEGLAKGKRGRGR